NNNIGIALARLNDGEKAIAYYKDALKIAENHDDNNAVLMVMANIVDSYIELKRPDQALVFMRSLPKNFLEPKSDESYIYAPLSYLTIYNAQKKYSAVQSYCNQILPLIKVHRPPDKLLHKFYSLLIGFYLESGQFASAKIYIGTIDSL